ncbi:MAG: TetR/AcrR family transcriptional regulator [Pseudomonadaceae bacterium]
MNTATRVRRYRGTTPQERRAERRQRLIDAAIEVYGTHGYRHSGVKQVCDAAGLTQRYFYESFGHSDELLIACYQQTAAWLRIANKAAGEAAGSDRLARFKAMLHSYFNILKEQPVVARLLLVEIRGISPEVDRAIDQTLQVTSETITRVLARPGEQLDPWLQAGMLGGTIHIALRWMAGGYAEPVEVVTEAAYRLGESLLA